MSSMHKMLLRQLKKSQANVDQIPAELLAMISESYTEFEEQIRRINHVNQINEEELVRKNEEIKRISENDFETMLNRLPFYVSWLDNNLVYQGVNANLETLIGIDRDKIIGQKIGTLPALNNDDFVTNVKMFAASELEEGNFEYVYKNNEGDKYVMTYLQKIHHGEKIIICGMDLTEKVNMQKKIDESRSQNEYSSRLVAVGEMAAGVAHEINNPLMIVKGVLHLLQNRTTISNPDEAKSVKDRVDKITKNVDRITGIVANLKILSRNADEMQFENAPMKELVIQGLSLCQQKIIDSQIIMHQTLEDNSLVNCYTSEIIQVIFNVINNSIDAIANNEDKWIKLESREDNGMAYLRVVDSGNGILPSILEKIFQPFYTTKMPGSGTGLGLSVSRTIMNKFNGNLYYELHEGHTSFVITLPAIKDVCVLPLRKNAA